MVERAKKMENISDVLGLDQWLQFEIIWVSELVEFKEKENKN